MKIAIVHDWIYRLSGSERVLMELHDMFPNAPIFTLFYNPDFLKKHFPDADVRASFLQKFPLICSPLQKTYVPLMPSAVESFDFSGYDTVISSSAVFSKGVIVSPGTRHICYCYSPSRQLWDMHNNYSRFLAGRLITHFLRIWDKQAAGRVDEFAAISKNVKNRIAKYYGREAKVIYPPLTLKSNAPISQGDFYLIVSRLYDYKNISIAIDAFNKIKKPLVIVGDGPNRMKLSRIAKSNIKFTGHLSDDKIAEYYASCRAFVMPQEEDFGLTPVEAMSFGKPVLALKKGGALEIIEKGVNGEFFDDPITECLVDGIRRLDANYPNYNPEKIKKSVKIFSREKFRNDILELING
ncbi:MAG: Glycosyl transferase group 1 [Candidatus Yanofskybacteria bacterium GW2011_GWA1_44_21]|uniref:Glycosyl transferase family 1 domain-containing protein n=2 Tax=Candidatus Yanofskyibacteriota TaxID=1752733 RepID=A0A1F8GZP5_9BACT|nr:MAG: Glycosyl transferase group 1 [Candidatus Yanofskybacteria bacterium GW2011_GWA2_44_10]KKT50520.1 MAG: Glycosyl transferase group 1 [Candidatus Yanofskybacteria bacterium GW2011_GWA1_44_21]KKT90288.1 MAG: Glycosyl transferase group 1 [Candidatus Yanofskybacteria bacterium GW2011_GWB1_45_11]OGN03058.1 MAG: hypothetical protein A2657_00735 [Candidatus Yanofskybacteria bacterium RIFCSPHIGHO2_01_FULL_44_110b]OGN14556.1 MAG: hypothetical protein A3C01_00510 [Candidatus Yanofskybacteria bacter